MNKLSKWFYDNTPVIMRRKTYREDLANIAQQAMAANQKVNDMLTRWALNSALTDLQELRNNTWDLERVDRIYGCLEDFKVSQSEDQND